MTVAQPRALRKNATANCTFTGTLATVPACQCKEGIDQPSQWALWKIEFSGQTFRSTESGPWESVPTQETVYVWRHVSTGDYLYADNGLSFYGDEDSTPEKAVALILRRHPGTVIA